jgi:hypothetical protein
MGEQFAGIIDVTIAYQPTGHSVAASFLRGEQRALTVEARLRPLPADLLDGDYHGDAGFRQRLQQWINGIWEEKDARIAQLHPAEHSW